MRPVGKTTRKHRRQVKAGKPRHKLVGGRTGGKTSHALKNFKRGKAAKSAGRARHNVMTFVNQPNLVGAWGFV